jgi:hypothetical protein
VFPSLVTGFKISGLKSFVGVSSPHPEGWGYMAKKWIILIFKIK